MSKITMKDHVGFNGRSQSIMEKVSSFMRENKLEKRNGSYYTRDGKFYGNLRNLIAEVEG